MRSYGKGRINTRSAMMSLSISECHTFGDQTGVTRLIAFFSCLVLSNSLPMKSNRGKEYGHRFFQFCRKASIIHTQRFGYQLTYLGIGWHNCWYHYFVNTLLCKIHSLNDFCSSTDTWSTFVFLTRKRFFAVNVISWEMQNTQISLVFWVKITYFILPNFIM